jgi:hypothetical protein
MNLQLGTRLYRLAVQIDAERECGFGRTVGDGEIGEPPLRDEVGLRHLLGSPAHGGDADAPWATWSDHLLNGLLNGALLLTQELPLARGLIARHIAGFL